MRIIKFAILGLLFVLVLSACGGGGGDGDPTKPVKDFFAGFEDMDAEKTAKTVCEQYRDDTETGLEALFGIVKMAGDDVKIEITGLEMKVEDEKDDEATIVATGGTLRFTVDGEVQDESELGEEDERMKVIKEDGKWVICDDAFLGDLSP